MADPTQLPPEARRPRLAKRPSRKVRAKGLATVRRRQELEVRLLELACANDPRSEPAFALDDLPLLVQIARERVAGSPLVRRSAVTVLGKLRDLAALETLQALAASPAEHENVRAAALVAIAGTSPALAPALIASYAQDEHPLVRQAAGEALRRLAPPPPSPGRRPRPAAPREPRSDGE